MSYNVTTVIDDNTHTSETIRVPIHADLEKLYDLRDTLCRMYIQPRTYTDTDTLDNPATPESDPKTDQNEIPKHVFEVMLLRVDYVQDPPQNATDLNHIGRSVYIAIILDHDESRNCPECSRILRHAYIPPTVPPDKASQFFHSLVDIPNGMTLPVDREMIEIVDWNIRQKQGIPYCSLNPDHATPFEQLYDNGIYEPIPETGRYQPNNIRL